MHPILLLGGSFNPAHAGHLYISRSAMKRLGIGECWWLVSPGNPLKDPKDSAPFAVRLAKAREVAKADRRIRVSAFEASAPAPAYTIDTLRRLKQRYPGICFIWLMGADNLAGFHRWKDWSAIFRLLPVVVVTRSPLQHVSLRSKAAIRFARFRQDLSKTTIYSGKGPKWSYLFMRPHPLSSTQIRKTLGKAGGLGHN